MVNNPEMEPNQNDSDDYGNGRLDVSVDSAGANGSDGGGREGAGGASDVVEEQRRLNDINYKKAKEAREKRKLKRQEELERIANSRQDDDEIQQIMSQADKDREGAFCTGLLTACFLLHFLAEVGGLTMNAPIYSMQSVLSEHFENRFINLPEYAENQQRLELLYQNGSTGVDLEDQNYRLYHNSTSHLYGMMTIKDVTKVEHLPTFARFVLDLVYPKKRESSNKQRRREEDDITKSSSRKLREEDEASASIRHRSPTAAKDDDATRRRLQATSSLTNTTGGQSSSNSSSSEDDTAKTTSDTSSEPGVSQSTSADAGGGSREATTDAGGPTASTSPSASS